MCADAAAPAADLGQTDPLVGIADAPVAACRHGHGSGADAGGQQKAPAVVVRLHGWNTPELFVHFDLRSPFSHAAKDWRGRTPLRLNRKAIQAADRCPYYGKYASAMQSRGVLLGSFTGGEMGYNASFGTGAMSCGGHSAMFIQAAGDGGIPVI